MSRHPPARDSRWPIRTTPSVRVRRRAGWCYRAPPWGRRSPSMRSRSSCGSCCSPASPTPPTRTPSTTSTWPTAWRPATASPSTPSGSSRRWAGRSRPIPILPVPSNAHWMPLASIVQVPFIWLLGPTAIASALPFALAGRAGRAAHVGPGARRGGEPAGGRGGRHPGGDPPRQRRLHGPARQLRALPAAGGRRALDGRPRAARGTPARSPWAGSWWAWPPWPATTGSSSARRWRSPSPGTAGAPGAAAARAAPRSRAWAAVACFGLFLAVVAPWLARQLVVFGSISPSTASGKVLFIRSIDEWNSITDAGQPGVAPGAGAGAARRQPDRRPRRGASAIFSVLVGGVLLVAVHGRRGLGPPPLGRLRSVLRLRRPPLRLLDAGLGGARAGRDVHPLGGRRSHPTRSCWRWRGSPWPSAGSPPGAAPGTLASATRFFSRRRDRLRGGRGDRQRPRHPGRRGPPAATTSSWWTGGLDDAGAATDDRVMSIDASGTLYWTGHGGVVLVNDPLDTIEEVARAYDIRWLVLNRADTVAAVAPILDGGPRPPWLGPPVASRPARQLPDAAPLPAGALGVGLYPVCLDAADTRCAETARERRAARALADVAPRGLAERRPRVRRRPARPALGGRPGPLPDPRGHGLLLGRRPQPGRGPGLRHRRHLVLRHPGPRSRDRRVRLLLPAPGLRDLAAAAEPARARADAGRADPRRTR